MQGRSSRKKRRCCRGGAPSKLDRSLRSQFVLLGHDDGSGCSSGAGGDPSRRESMHRAPKRVILQADILHWLRDDSISSHFFGAETSVVCSLPDMTEMGMDMDEYKAWWASVAGLLFAKTAPGQFLIFYQSDVKSWRGKATCTEWLSKVGLAMQAAALSQRPTALLWHKVFTAYENSDVSSSSGGGGLQQSQRRRQQPFAVGRPGFSNMVCFGVGSYGDVGGANSGDGNEDDHGKSDDGEGEAEDGCESGGDAEKEEGGGTGGDDGSGGGLSQQGPSPELAPAPTPPQTSSSSSPSPSLPSSSSPSSSLPLPLPTPPPSYDPKAALSPDVLGRGPQLWSRGTGLVAAHIACAFLRAQPQVRCVLSPCCGVGTFPAMANACGLDSVGVELNLARCAHSQALHLSLAAIVRHRILTGSLPASAQLDQDNPSEGEGEEDKVEEAVTREAATAGAAAGGGGSGGSTKAEAAAEVKGHREADEEDEGAANGAPAQSTQETGHLFSSKASQAVFITATVLLYFLVSRGRRRGVQ